MFSTGAPSNTRRLTCIGTVPTGQMGAASSPGGGAECTSSPGVWPGLVVEQRAPQS